MRIEQQNLGQLGQHRINGMDVQGAEAGGEVALRPRRERLVTKQEHLALDQELAQAVDDGLRQLVREVDAAHDAAEAAGQMDGFDGHGIP